MNFITIIPQQIDWHDRLFFIKNGNTDDLIPKKITTFYNPIWVQETSPDRYRIVDGFLLAELFAQDQKSEPIPACVFKSNTLLSDVWLQRVVKRQAEKNLMPLALLESLKTLLYSTKTETPPAEVVSILLTFGVPEALLTLTALNRVIGLMHDRCGFCDLYALTYREIESLSRRNEQELESLSILFSDLKLKGNKLQSLLQIMDELVKGYQLSPQAVLAKEETKILLNQCPAHMKYKTLKTYLMALRWPVLDKTQKKWQQSVKKMAIPGKLEITTDPWFESNEIEFTLKASSLEEFKSLMTSLHKVSTAGEFSQLFDFI